MAPRTYIRHRDIRLITEDLESPDFDVSEHEYARGRYFQADCLITDLPGDFVSITGSPVSSMFQVSRVDISDAGTMPAVGFIAEKSSDTRCFVVTFGVVPATGLTPGQRYWVGQDGQLSDFATLKASIAGGKGYAQIVGHALSETELLIRPEGQATGLRG